MKRVWGAIAAVVVTIFFVTPALAGPSRALIQEMGSVIGAEEVNIDVDWVGQSLNVTGAGDTTVGAGGATIGSILLSSVNVGLTESAELRIGRLPGLRSYLTLPVGSGNNYGLTLKGGNLPAVPGLAGWVGYGLANLEDITGVETEGSSWRLGLAYTWAGPVILNGTLGYGLDTSSAAGTDGPDTTAFEIAAAVLYPVRPSLLVGAELHYAAINVDTDPDETDLAVLAPALGARIIAGNWTIDALVALVGTSVGVESGPLDETATATVIGVPNLRINYKF